MEAKSMLHMRRKAKAILNKIAKDQKVPGAIQFRATALGLLVSSPCLTDEKLTEALLSLLTDAKMEIAAPEEPKIPTSIREMAGGH